MTLAPVKPPRAWFEEMPPELSPTNMKYIGSAETGDQGRIAAYYFTWDQCLEEGKRGECWKPEKSRNNYQLFHQGSVETAEGDVISVGTVGAGGGHAPYAADAKTAAAVYADTNNQRFVATLHEDEVGGYFLGSFVPEITEKQIAEVRRSPLSADFRWRHKAPDKAGGHFSGYDNIGPWLVTRPGFPLTRAASFAEAMEAHEGILTAPLDTEPCCSDCATARLAAAPAAPGQAPVQAQSEPAPPSGIAGLQVGVNGFQGFEDAPIGGQLGAAGLDPSGENAPAGPDPHTAAQVEALETKVRELEDRISELEAIMTGHLLQGADAPELILNEGNMNHMETHDTAEFNGFFTYENSARR